MEEINSEEIVEQALIWILSILAEVNISYQIAGGLAARAYGANRPIADIDIYIPYSAGKILSNKLQEYITKPLLHHQENEWDLEYFQVKYQNQKIEFALSPGTKIFDKRSNSWVPQTIDFSKPTTTAFRGVQFLAMPKAELINYKSILNREVDRIDIEGMRGAD